MKRVTVFRPHIPLVAATAALTAGLLAGCGGETPVPPPAKATAQAAAEPVAAGTPCGQVPSSGGTQSKVVVRGKVDCAQATSLLTEYFGKLTPAEAGSPDGPGPIALGDWTCGSGPVGDPVTACSTEDDRQIEAVRAG